jgi:hypothetical protein
MPLGVPLLLILLSVTQEEKLIMKKGDHKRTICDFNPS